MADGQTSSFLKEKKMSKLIQLTVSISLLTLFVSCGKVVDKFGVEVGTNEVTTTADFTKDFALNLDGSFPIDIKGQNYGEIFLNAAQGEDPFQVGVSASIEAFTSDTWDGFDNTSTLPNGDPLPGWIAQDKLIVVDIPDFNQHFDIKLYVGYDNPYYVGVAVTLNILDNHYPEGLSISQNFKKEESIWGEVMAFGPTKDSDGNVINHGGIFFVAQFTKGEVYSREGVAKNSKLLINGQSAKSALKSRKDKRKFHKKMKMMMKGIKKESELF